MNLNAKTEINQRVDMVFLKDIKIGGKMYSLNVNEGAPLPGEPGALWLNFYCQETREKLWIIIGERGMHINRERSDMGRREDREAFLSKNGEPFKWMKWSECAGEIDPNEKSIEFGFPAKEVVDENPR